MIGILIPEFPSQTHIIFWREIAALRALGESVSIISTTRPDPKACLHDFAQPSRQETHYIYPPRLAVALKTLAARPLGAGRAVRYVLGLGQSTALERAKKLGYLLCAADLLDHCRRRGIEHLHVHSCAEAAHIAAITNILGGPPYSLTLHGDLPVYGKDHAKKMARAKFVATAGAHLKPQIVKHAGYPESRVLPTFLGLDLGRFRCELGARSREPNALRLTTVGRLDLCKGHRHALAAIRAAVDQGYDIRYTIAGQGPHRAEIEAEVKRLGLEDRVAFTGSLPEEGVVRLLNQSDAFILSSVGLGEAYPNVLLEAMACGVPVISSIIGSTPDIVTHGTDGLLVEQGDEPGFTGAIVTLARDPERRLSMGEAAREKALRSFDARATSGRLLAAIRAEDGAVPVDAGAR